MTPVRRTLFYSLLLFAALGSVAQSQIPGFGSKPKHLTAELVSEMSTIAPGKPFRVKVKLTIEPHWHTYGKTVPENVTGAPTGLNWTLPDGWKVQDLAWPPTKPTPSAEGPVPAYEGTVYIPVLITPAANFVPGGPAKIAVQVDAVVCDLQNCVPMRDLAASLELKTAAEPVVDAAHADLFKEASPQVTATTMPKNQGLVPAPVPKAPSELQRVPSSPPPSVSAPLVPGPASIAGTDSVPGLKLAPLVNANAKKMTATLLSEQSTIAAGKPFRVVVKLEILPHWHTYGKSLPADVTGKPTALDWSVPNGWKVEDLPWPPTKDTPSAGGATVPAYEGTVYLPVLLTPPANLAPGPTSKISVGIDAVVCDLKNCVPLRDLSASLELSSGAAPVIDTAQADVFKTVPPASAAASAKSPAPAAPPVNLPLFLLFAFIGGLILNIMPCVFPVLAIKITSVVSQAHDEKGKVLMHGLAYTLGVLVCLWSLDGILIAANAGGGSKGWGYQFQEPWFVFGVVLIMLIFGLNMAGLFEVGTSAIGVGDKLTAKSGLSGSFFSGLFATVVATPCTAPFLANALTFALSLPPLGSLGVFTFIGLGLASPYLLFGLFPSLLKKLPRPGAWMESFKQAMSFPMLGAAAYFTWVLLGLVSEDNGRDILIGMVIIAMACWVYGRWSVLSKPTPVRIRAIVIAIAFFALGLWWASPRAEAAKTGKTVPGVVTWGAWSPETVAALRKDKKPVYIDFTARWCATCQVNHRVYSDTTLANDFNKRGVTLLKADWTKPDERIEKALAELGESAVPVNILYVPDRDQPVVLPKTLTVSNVQAALAELDKK